MKRYTNKQWAVAVVLAICVADCVGIYAAQMRLHHQVPISSRDTAYADATAVKDTWRGSAPSPEAQRAYANTMAYAPTASTRTAPAAPAPKVAPAPQRLAQAAIAVPAFKPRTDPFLAEPRLAEAAPAERVELATEVHTAQHRAVLRHAALRIAQRDKAPPTSQSFAAAFGTGGANALELPVPSFGKQAEVDNTPVDLATTAPVATATDSPRIDMGESATIGKSSAPAADPELPAAPVAVDAAAQPGN